MLGCLLARRQLCRSFLLQHCGTMNRGEPSLAIHVVPDSGTDDLTGLAGSLKIDIVDGKHFYEFDYEFRGTWRSQSTHAGNR